MGLDGGGRAGRGGCVMGLRKMSPQEISGGAGSWNPADTGAPVAILGAGPVGVARADARRTIEAGDSVR